MSGSWGFTPRLTDSGGMYQEHRANDADRGRPNPYTGRKVSGEAAFQSAAQDEGASSSNCPGRSHS